MGTEQKEMKKVKSEQKKMERLWKIIPNANWYRAMKEEMWKAHEQTHGSILPG